MKVKIYFNWNTNMAWIYKNRLPKNPNDEPDEIMPIIEAYKEYIATDLPSSILVEVK